MELLTFDALKSLLEECKDKRVLLTFHSIGDTDSVASAFALSGFFPNSRIATPDFITANCKRILQKLGFSDHEITSKFDDDAELVIMLDVNRFEECGPFSDKLGAFKGQILIIDHHAPNEIRNSNVAVFNEEDYAATSSIVYDILDSLGCSLNKDIAALVALGIISDSADFMNSTSKTFEQVGRLIGISGLEYPEMLEIIRHIASPDSRAESISGLFHSNVEVKNKLVFVYGKALFHANHSADNALKIGADVAIFYTLNGNDITFSARLRSPLDKQLGIHLGTIMKELAPIINGTGGGHPCAAGVYGKASDENYEKLINRFISEISAKAAKKPKQSA